MLLTIDKVSIGRALVPNELFARLTARIAQDHPELAADLPARIMDQALARFSAPAPPAPSRSARPSWSTSGGTPSSCTPPTTPSSASASPAGSSTTSRSPYRMIGSRPGRSRCRFSLILSASACLTWAFWSASQRSVGGFVSLIYRFLDEARP
jgi:hypothetical protein